MAKKTKTIKHYTPSITKRFLLIVDEVIREGSIGTRTEFAQAVGEHQQNLALMEKGTRAPTLEHIAVACKKFGYSPTWLVLGTGDKKLKVKDQKGIEDRVSELEAIVASLKNMIKRSK
jgi:hypothetical protein